MASTLLVLARNGKYGGDFQGGTPWTLLTIIGLVTILYLARRFLSFAKLYVRLSRIGRYMHSSVDEQGNSKQQWALVTGTSDGIGRRLAAELATCGFNIVLHGCNNIKLVAVEAELRREFQAWKFRLLVADLGKVPCANCFAAAAPTTRGAVEFKSIVAQLCDLTVVLSNACGWLNPTSATLDTYSHHSIPSNVSLGMLSPLHLLARLVALMARNGLALVINIGSQADMGVCRYCPSMALQMSLRGIWRVASARMAVLEGMRTARRSRCSASGSARLQKHKAA
ncbi:hypothetical protein PspLS_03107 [Pyricularia sp. CBS 133598]|nr:hypothetical protein PspLS_03107 [Pyricularia sp. CBS 133598]